MGYGLNALSVFCFGSPFSPCGLHKRAYLLNLSFSSLVGYGWALL